ncbi:MAG: orc1/cdc6 family replication initiation protein [Thermoprotei archaeon]
MAAQNLFSNIGQTQNHIFKNRAAMVSDFVPLTLPHRENEIRRLAQIVAPALTSTRPNNAFMYGLTGTGKTAVLKYVLKVLIDEAGKRGVGVEVAYVNGRKDDTGYRVLTQIGRQLHLSLPFTGLSVSEVYSRIVEHIDKIGKIVVISIDEIDNLVRENTSNLLYKITRINSDLVKAQVSLIGITNDSRVLESLDPRVRSSLGEEELVFAPYDSDQLNDILQVRALDAFNPGVLEEGVIPYVAALAAKDHGDARKAVDLLRKAGEVAERNGDRFVETGHVKQALTEIETDTALEILEKLPFHSKLVLASIVKLSQSNRNVITGDVYAMYLSMCSKLGTEILTARRISEIVSELDMVGIISTKILNRGRFGRTKKILVNVDPKNIWVMLSRDPLLATL